MKELDQARQVVEFTRSTLRRSIDHLARECTTEGQVGTSLIDQRQSYLYDLASLSSAVAAAEALLKYGESGSLEGRLALVFASEVASDMAAKLEGRWDSFGLDFHWEREHAKARMALSFGRHPALLQTVAQDTYRRKNAEPHSESAELNLLRSTFRKFAEEKVLPVAESIHRHDEDVPDNIIQGLAKLGCFGMSIPEEYGGFGSQTGEEHQLMYMLIATEELSRASLAAAGSLITRPEIISATLLAGGTEAQRQRWLPQIAAGEKMCAVAVTEPDYGSDVARITTRALRDGDHWLLNGVKTWCTFAGRAEYILLLARTDPDRSKGHRGLSLFVLEKPPSPGHEFVIEQEGGGRISGQSIRTLGYRGMHSFEVSIENWRLPHRDLIGEDEGLGKGFYLQMHAFATGRVQTAARALGLMEAAFEAALAHTQARQIFGRSLSDFELTQSRIAKMAALIAACRQFSYSAARKLGTEGNGQLEASQVKQFSCRAAEWLTREAQQLHGGYGYAEEYPVSRHFVDARVLSIFEGTDETLALRVIARRLLNEAQASDKSQRS